MEQNLSNFDDPKNKPFTPEDVHVEDPHGDDMDDDLETDEDDENEWDTDDDEDE